jgi:hypothetical protein
MTLLEVGKVVHNVTFSLNRRKDFFRWILVCGWFEAAKNEERSKKNGNRRMVTQKVQAPANIY